jgi:uncharacterized protein (DUF1684 family)
VAVLSKLSPFMATLALLCAMTAPSYAGADDYNREIQRWQSERLSSLTSADSWLSVTNADILQKGISRIGSGADEDIVLSTGPSHLGLLTYATDGTISLALAKGSRVSIDPEPSVHGHIEPFHVSGLYFEPDGSLTPVNSKASHATQPTVLHVDSATLKFYAYDSDLNHGEMRLIATDAHAPARARFHGLDYFPVDASWKITARWELLALPREVDVAYVHGTVTKDKIIGKVVFVRDGKQYELLPYKQGDNGDLLFVFADATSGKETYGGARFLFASAPKDGKVILDFNKAINPPCALIPFPNCPLASPENHLAVRVAAGEKKVDDQGWPGGR